MPKPDPALKRLDILVGTWSLRGRTLDSEADNVIGMTTFDWLPGGFFLRQTFEADYWGLKIQSLEIISYDPKAIHSLQPSTPMHMDFRFHIDGMFEVET